MQPIIDDIKKKGAWDILVKYVEKYYDNPLQELEKLNYILDTKYGINIDSYIFIDLIESAKLKELVQNRKILIEIQKFEEEIYGGNDNKKQIENKKLEQDKTEENIFKKYEENQFIEVIEEKKLEELKENHLKEIEKLIKETRQLDKVKEKIQKWKAEGYDVSEIEKLLEEVK